MKKLLFIPIFLLTLFVSMNNVKADTSKKLYYYFASSDSIPYSDAVNDISTSWSSNFSLLYDFYSSNYSSIYPYFSYGPYNELHLYTSIPTFSSNSGGYYLLSSAFISYNGSSFDLINSSDTFEVINDSDTIFGANYIYSNFSLSFPYSYDSYILGYKSSNGIDENATVKLSTSSVIPTFSDFLDVSSSYDDSSDSLVEINLNNYAYVALSLKDYNQSNFTTTFMVKGQLCPTPVYNYGMTEKSFYNTSYKVQSCSPAYNSFTSVRFTVLENDIENHAIYYLKAYDTSIDNIVKVNSNVFDISYITSQDASNPYVEVGGKTYPTIPYNDLSSSSTLSTDKGYVSGASENVFDITSDSNYITDLFSNPLQALQSAWVSIVSFFNLIATFIGLLPPTLSAFLIASFALSLILGVLKLIL